MKILAVTSELYPLIKTGGLADVAGALPSALSRHGVEVRTLVPGYPSVMQNLRDAATETGLGPLFGHEATVQHHVIGSGLEILVVDAPHLFDREGGPYSDGAGHDWPDNPVRFAGLAQAAQRIAQSALGTWVPDIVHVHDWQAGLVPAYLSFSGVDAPRSVMTIHNLAFQGQFSPALLGVLGIPAKAYSVDGVEYYGGIGFLKAGIYYADHVTTVSPAYAREIQTTGVV